MVAAAAAGALSASADDSLVRPAGPGAPAAWGVRGGIRFGVWPTDVSGGPGSGGPRGLIRVGYPVTEGDVVSLINFIAIEPIVAGQAHRSFSELEPSTTDGQPGKAIHAGPPPGAEWAPEAGGGPYPGHVERLPGGASRLTVRLDVERFTSGAHVYLLASVSTDRPDELELRAFTQTDSPELAACVLTATMGNLERLRELHLATGVVRARDLYPNLEGDGFGPHHSYGLHALLRGADGGPMVAATTDEDEPSRVHPAPELPWLWHYPGRQLTQYWRKAPGEYDDTLRAQVNARRVYWASRLPIPGGVAFENFELVERFVPGRASVFGLTPRAPCELYAAAEQRTRRETP